MDSDLDDLPPSSAFDGGPGGEDVTVTVYARGNRTVCVVEMSYVLDDLGWIANHVHQMAERHQGNLVDVAIDPAERDNSSGRILSWKVRLAVERDKSPNDGDDIWDMFSVDAK